MERIERLPLLRAIGVRIPALDPGAIGAWAFAAALVAYLSLEGGGYDPIVRGEVAVAVWVAVLAGFGVGALRFPYRSPAALAITLLLLAYTAWTALGLTWTDSAERTAAELARVTGYLGILVLALGIAARGYARQLLLGATFAVAVVCGLAVLSRLQLDLFPANVIGTFLPGIEVERRLAYPLNYASAVGAYAGLSIPLILAATASARTIAGQAMAATALPIAGFAVYLTTSGTGLAAVIAATLVFLALSGDRLPKLATLALGAGGTAILGAELGEREALDRGLPTPAALAQGDELLAVAILVMLGVGLVQAAISLAVRWGERPRWLRIERREALVATGIAIVVAIPLALAVGLPGAISERWDAFQDRGAGNIAQSDRNAAILDPSSSGRYQFWESAADAGSAEPVTGIGPGTFEFWWLQDPEFFGFARDAHSLYAESYGELGWPGLLLIGGLVLAILGFGTARALRASAPARLRIAAATAGAAGFAVAAGLDWLWEIAALPAIFLLLAAVLALDRDPEADPTAAARRPRSSTRRRRARQERIARLAVAVLAVAALYAIARPLIGATELRESQIAYATGNSEAALAAARDGADAQPYAAGPLIQQALVLEARGEYAKALPLAREGARKEAVNYRNWLILSRLRARTGDAEGSVGALERAIELNPRLAPATE